MTTDFRALSAELLAAIQLYAGLNPAASEMSSVEKTEKLMDAMAATVAALATPPPEPPTDEERLALQEKLWVKYKTIPYQGAEFMYGDAFESALSDYRAALEKWKRLATPPPLAPNYIDPEHHGEDRELLQVFYAACNAEGGTADEIHLRGIRAVMAACATPPPEPPTDEELWAFWNNHDGPIPAILRAALGRWGR